jgi:magnesium-protoporphyrin O-methyltransferase
MSACCSTFERSAEAQFSREKAVEELSRFQTKGPGPTTTLLREGVVQAGAASGLLLDVGCGIGALTFGLLGQGMTSAVGVDASTAYLQVAREEAERRSPSHAIRFVHGDFVSVADQLPRADVVTLDRVVCCYPLYESLLNVALRRAERCVALSYPRDVWSARAAVRLENATRVLSRNPFRTFVHPVAQMERIIEAAGFELRSRRQTWMWSADVYTRS